MELNLEELGQLITKNISEAKRQSRDQNKLIALVRNLNHAQTISLIKDLTNV